MALTVAGGVYVSSRLPGDAPQRLPLIVTLANGVAEYALLANDTAVPGPHPTR